MDTQTQAFNGFDQFGFGEEIPFRKREWLLFYPSHQPFTLSLPSEETHW